MRETERDVKNLFYLMVDTMPVLLDFIDHTIILCIMLLPFMCVNLYIYPFWLLRYFIIRLFCYIWYFLKSMYNIPIRIGDAKYSCQ